MTVEKLANAYAQTSAYPHGRPIKRTNYEVKAKSRC